MKLENLHLEITRNCTLECEHCLRGNRQNVNMNPELVNYIFQDIKNIDWLLLTGGEPFLAIDVIEKIVLILKTKKIRVNKLTIITNGTILNERIIKALEELSNLTYLILLVSNDIFHKIELYRLNLYELREKNLKTLEDLQLIGHINLDYGSGNNNRLETSIIRQGNASNLTDERLKEINELAKQKIILLDPILDKEEILTYNDDKIIGKLAIDVYGNIIKTGQTYIDEDIEAENSKINISQISLNDAVRDYIAYLANVKENNEIKKLTHTNK